MYFRGISLAIASFFFCANAIGDEITIAYSDLVKPFLYIENDNLQGIDLDIMNAVASNLSLDINYVYMPWARALLHAKQGQVDGLLSVYCKQPDNDLLLSSEQSYKTNISVFTLKSSGLTRKDLYATETRRLISVVRGNYYVPKLSRYPQLTKVELTDLFAQGYQLLKGNVDFSVSEEAWFLVQMASRKAVDKVIILEVLDSTSVCLAFSKRSFDNNPNFISQVDEELRSLKESGLIDRLFRRYGLPAR